MNNLSVSPIDAINAAIQSYNPFKNAGIVKEQNIWGKDFLDLASLNKKASDSIFEAIQQVKTSQSSHDKVTSVLLTAQNGVGKTHILSRIRHRLELEGGGLFVYSSVDKYDLDLIAYQFQQTLSDSLRYTGSQKVMQWQEVAAEMANEGLKSSKNSPPLTPENLVNKFDQAYAKSLTKNKNLIEELTAKVLKTKPNASLYIVKSILWTLSEKYGNAAIEWLSGKEIAQFDAEYMGLPFNANKTSQDREGEALNIVTQILNLVSFYNPVIICFDQLDVESKINNAGLTAPHVIAEFVSTIYNNLSQSELGQGVVIITVMFPGTFADKVDLMSKGIRDRISTYTNLKPIELNPPNGNAIVELVEIWLREKLYKPRGLTPPHPVYPFEEEQLRELAKLKLTVREILNWCADNFKVCHPPLPENTSERFELALNTEIEAITADNLEDNDLIAEALRFAFETLKGQILNGETLSGEILNNVKIEDIEEVRPKADNHGWINFKVIVTDDNETGKKIGVAVIQSNLASLTAGLKRLNDYEKFDLSRGCLVRSLAKTENMNKKSEAYKLLSQLIDNGGELVDLVDEYIKPLIALNTLYKNRENYNLTEQQICDLVAQKKLAEDNALLREILSDSSGDIDEDDLYNFFVEEASNDNPDDSEDLSDLFADSDTPSDEANEQQPINEDLDEEKEDNSPIKSPDPYKGKSIKGFIFQGTRYEVNTWKDLLLTLCEVLKNAHVEDFDRVQNLPARKIYFSQEPEKLRKAQQITENGLYVETSLPTNQIVSLIKRMIAFFGYPEDSLFLDIQEKNKS